MKHFVLGGFLAAALCACHGVPVEDPDGGPGEHLDGKPVEDLDSTPADDASAACDAIELAPPELGIQVTLPITVPPGEEREYCMLLQVDEGFEMNSSDGRFTLGSHHALVYKTSYKEIPTTTVSGDAFEGDPTEPHPCITPGDLWDTQGVIAGGRTVDTALRELKEGTLTRNNVLPDNVAFHIKAGDVLLFNFHMLNYTEEAVDSCFKVNLIGVPPDQVEHEAGTIFFYNPFITLSAGSSGSARLACPVTRDVTLLSAVSHMHQRGVHYESYLWDGDPSEGGSERVKELHESDTWTEPVDDVFEDGTLELKEGQWIDWQCDYQNPEERKVSQGFMSTDEMCMFIGTYYPKDREFETCGTGGFSNGRTLSTGGTKNGADFLECLGSVNFTLIGAGDDPQRYATQACFTQTCDEVAPLLMPLLDCLIDNGAGECGDLRSEIAEATCGD